MLQSSTCLFRKVFVFFPLPPSKRGDVKNRRKNPTLQSRKDNRKRRGFCIILLFRAVQCNSDSLLRHTRQRVEKLVLSLGIDSILLLLTADERVPFLKGWTVEMMMTVERKALLVSEFVWMLLSDLPLARQQVYVDHRAQLRSLVTVPKTPSTCCLHYCTGLRLDLPAPFLVICRGALQTRFSSDVRQAKYASKLTDLSLRVSASLFLRAFTLLAFAVLIRSGPIRRCVSSSFRDHSSNVCSAAAVFSDTIYTIHSPRSTLSHLQPRRHPLSPV